MAFDIATLRGTVQNLGGIPDNPLDLEHIYVGLDYLPIYEAITAGTKGINTAGVWIQDGSEIAYKSTTLSGRITVDRTFPVGPTTQGFILDFTETPNASDKALQITTTSGLAELLYLDGSGLLVTDSYSALTDIEFANDLIALGTEIIDAPSLTIRNVTEIVTDEIVGTNDDWAILTGGGDTVVLNSTAYIAWTNGSSTVDPVDVRFQRDGSNGFKIVASNGVKMAANAPRFRGWQTSAADPGLLEFPSHRDYGWHENTTSGNIYWTVNDSGVIKKQLMT